jgi:hypothetical protein
MTEPSTNALYQRAATIVVGMGGDQALTFQCGKGTGLDVEFTIKRGLHISKKSSKPIPNTCDLKIWGLTRDHAHKLQAATTPSTPTSATAGSSTKTVPCVVSAGYVGRQSVIFSGEMRSCHCVRNGCDLVAELSTGDGVKAITQTRLSVAIPKGSSAANALRTIISALGVGQGNLAKALDLLGKNPMAATLYSTGCVFKGSAAEIMTDFCRTCDLEWSVQNGQIQFLDLGHPLTTQAVQIDPKHGLVGSPSVDSDGLLSFTALMIPDLKPGALVNVDSEFVQGGFRVQSIEWTGGTKGDTWYCQCEASRY